MELRLAVRMVEALFKQTRRAGMIFSRARPEDAVVRFDLFPGNAVVIGIATSRRDAQLIENLARRIEVEIFLAPEAARDFLHDPPIRACLPRRVVGFVDLHDAAFAVAGHAFVFAPG